MIKILITGANSYIGTSFEQWVKQWQDQYTVDTVDMQSKDWNNVNFSGYDVVFHVAGFVHYKETNKNRDLYYQVNRDLAFDTAKKAKEEGVKQFLFLSTMNVYGISIGVIKENTIPKPRNSYGDSKLQAELKINTLKDNCFNIAILRYFNPVGAHPSGLIGEAPSGIPNNLMPYISQVAAKKLKELKVFGNDYETIDFKDDRLEDNVNYRNNLFAVVALMRNGNGSG